MLQNIVVQVMVLIGVALPLETESNQKLTYSCGHGSSYQVEDYPDTANANARIWYPLNEQAMRYNCSSSLVPKHYIQCDNFFALYLHGNEKLVTVMQYGHHLTNCTKD